MNYKLLSIVIMFSIFTCINSMYAAIEYERDSIEKFADPIIPFDLINSNSDEESSLTNRSKIVEFILNSNSNRKNMDQQSTRPKSAFLEVETDGFGQLRAILDANNGSEVDSLVVVGFMDKFDFKAIWDCAVYGNMQVLNLEGVSMDNNAVPDKALYDPIQFDAGFWLKMRRIMLPEGIESIGKAAFAYMGLQQINIPSTIRTIGSSAFAYNKWLNCEIVIPEGVKEIKYQTFIECIRLTMSPKLPKSLTSIGQHAFAMTRFDNLDFPPNIETIGQGAFEGCCLREVILPKSCLNIGSMAFQLCTELQEIKLPDSLETIPSGLFSNCYALERVSINDQCRRIGAGAFMGCTNLREVAFNNGLESIDNAAFNGCTIEEVNLPPSLVYLGFNSFLCIKSSLKDVFCAAIIPPMCEELDGLEWRPFPSDQDIEDVTLYVPYGTRDLYLNTWGWDVFNNVIETESFPWSGIEQPIEDYSIETLDNSPNDHRIYDIYGRPVQQMQKGNLYIKDGKKYICRK